MDPITLAITSALGNLGAKVIQDAYTALNVALQSKYGIKSDLCDAIQRLEQKPDSSARKALLEEEVTAAQAQQDLNLVKAADELLSKLQDLPNGHTVIRQEVKGNRNIFSGAGDVTVTNQSQD